jgi:hypothetical protein
MLAFLLSFNLIGIDSLILGASSGPFVRRGLVLPVAAMFGVWGFWASVLNSLVGLWWGLAVLAVTAVVITCLRPRQLWIQFLPLLGCIDNLVTPPLDPRHALTAAFVSAGTALVGLVLGRAFLPVQWARPAVVAAACVVLVT